MDYDSLIDKFKDLKKKFQEKTDDHKKLEKEFEILAQRYRELQQEKLLSEQYNKSTKEKTEKLKKSFEDCKEKYDDKEQSSLENEQEKLLLEEQKIIEARERRIAVKKYYKVIIISAITIAIISGVSLYFLVEFTGQQYRVEINSQPTGYTIQNLKGDTVDTWLSWRLVEGDILHVNILNAKEYDKQIIDVVKSTLISEEIIEIDDSLLHKGPLGTSSQYYLGWLTALNEASITQTSINIPVKIELIESQSGEGDIIIELTNQRNADGFAGWTNSIADETQHQILKSRITIFAVDSLSLNEIETIVRHELGHAFGLAHSTAPEDLMHPTIETNYPYISECDIDAIVFLYDGGESSEVVCEK